MTIFWGPDMTTPPRITPAEHRAICGYRFDGAPEPVNRIEDIEPGFWKGVLVALAIEAIAAGAVAGAIILLS